MQENRMTQPTSTGKVAIVTDSTATLPPELCKGLNITTVPLQVIWGEETLRDGIDIDPAHFYTRLVESKIMPTTSQPSPAAFSAVYSRLIEEGFDILSVHISTLLSGTFDSATQARQNFSQAHIEIIDSLTTSMGMGFPILTAARAAQQGATLQECKVIVERLLSRSSVHFVLNTLEYLHRGGRIGGAAAFFGTALNLKPVLELRDGRIEATERVRTWNKAVDRLLDIYEHSVDGQRPIRLAVLHANAEEEADRLLTRARLRFNTNEVSEAFLAPISPVLGVHTGPGCLGVVTMTGM
jgi:DegV family protein with EDD domain